MVDSPTRRGPDRTHHSVSRRTLLTGLVGTGMLSTAGCSTLLNRVADAALGEVNIFNETARPLAGTVEITGPEGDRSLSAEFDLTAKTPDEPTAEATAGFDEVWGAAGAHAVRVSLADGLTVRGESRTSRTVTIDQPDEQMLAIAFGADDVPEGIYFAVATEFTEFR